MRRTFGIALALLCAALSAAPAASECAWVLWELGNPDQDPFRFSVAETRQVCLTNAADYAKAEVRAYQGVPGAPPMNSIVAPLGATVIEYDRKSCNFTTLN